MKLKLTIAALVGLGFSACTNSSLSTPKTTYQKPTASKLTSFQHTMGLVAKSTKKDKNYHKIAFTTTEEKLWFKDLMYRFWDRQITRDQFISEGVLKYPSHRYEFAFVSNGFQKHS